MLIIHNHAGVLSYILILILMYIYSRVNTQKIFNPKHLIIIKMEANFVPIDKILKSQCFLKTTNCNKLFVNFVSRSCTFISSSVCLEKKNKYFRSVQLNKQCKNMCTNFCNCALILQYQNIPIIKYKTMVTVPILSTSLIVQVLN